MPRPCVLVGDIGGTHSRFAIYDGGLGSVSVTMTSDANTLKEAAASYLDGAGQMVEACCVAVAGPVVNGGARLTNSDWVGHCDDLDVPTRIVNDLEGAAHGVYELRDADLVWWEPPSEDSGNTLVLGVGTGFGGALIRDGEVLALEPGHDLFVPRDRTNFGSLLQAGTTVEDMVSGPGLVGIWRHLCAGRQDISLADDAVGPWVLANAEDQAHAAETARVFRTALADAVMGLVQNHNANRVLLLGGVTEAWAGHLGEHSVFADLTALTGCGVGWIRHPYPALLGAARIARSLI